MASTSTGSGDSVTNQSNGESSDALLQPKVDSTGSDQDDSGASVVNVDCEFYELERKCFARVDKIVM